MFNISPKARFSSSVGNGLFHSASLDLNFAKTKSLIDSRTGLNLVTFTRASSGTYVDSQGVIRTATTNLLLRSEEFDNTTVWGNSVGTITRNANVTTAPNGTLTADELVFAAADNAVAQSVTVVSGISYAVSIWIKGTAGQTIRFTANNIPGGSNVTLTGEWSRYSFVGTSTGTNATLNISTFGSVTARSIYVWGAQLEQSSTVGEYIPTTSTINSAPRFDHNPTTGESLGLLVEEQRTNLLLQSGNLYETGTGGVNWIYPSGVMSDNTQVAPDGTTTADTLTTTGGAQSIYQSATVTASTTYTGSVYVRLGTMAASDFKVAVYNNSTPGFIAADVVPSQTPTSSGWTRISYSFTTPVGCTSVRWYPFRNSISLGIATVHLWGAQLEAGSFPTSYIPTTTATVTRAADVASISGSNFSSWYRQDEGTVFADVTVLSTSRTNQTISFNDGTANNRFELRPVGSADQMRTDCTVNGVTKYANAAFALTGQRRVGALAVKANDFRMQSGATGVNAISDAVPTVNRLYLNYATFAGGEINGTIRRLCYWSQRLPNETLQTITN